MDLPKQYDNNDLHPEHLKFNDVILEATRQLACEEAEERQKEIRALQLYSFKEGFTFNIKKKDR